MADPSDNVTLEIEGTIARLQISNPGKRNAFTWRMYEQLQAACDVVSADPGIRVMMLRGDAEDGFAAGTDIRQFTEFTTGADGIRYEQQVGAVLSAVAAVPVPTIAIVHRHAIGAGLAVAAMCDLVLAERGARFGAPIALTLGNCIPVAVVDRLRARVGPGWAAAMLLSARLVEAEDLAGTGFVTGISAADDLEADAEHLARRVADGAPLTVRALKQMTRRLDETRPLPDAEDLLDLCYASDDFHAGVRAFLDRRRPEWSGR